MKFTNGILALMLITMLSSFSQKNKIITISNSLNTDREFETVEISKTSLGLKASDKLEYYRVKELGTSTYLISQCVDENGDGINDVLLFQPKIKALATKKYEITGPVEMNHLESKLLIRVESSGGSDLVDLLDDVVKIQGIKGKKIFRVRLDPYDL